MKKMVLKTLSVEELMTLSSAGNGNPKFVVSLFS